MLLRIYRRTVSPHAKKIVNDFNRPNQFASLSDFLLWNLYPVSQMKQTGLQAAPINILIPTHLEGRKPHAHYKLSYLTQ